MKKKLLAALAGTIVSAALLIGGVQIYNYIEQSIISVNSKSPTYELTESGAEPFIQELLGQSR